MGHQFKAGNAGSSAVDEDLAAVLARHIVALRFEDLPAEVVAATKLCILDTLSATLAGSTQPGIAPIIKTLREWHADGESSVALYGHRLPACEAIVANVAMAHALEIDDAHYPAIVHPTAPTLWAALAIAQARGGIDGKALITAVAGGIDLMVRLGLAAQKTLYLGYHTALISGFGAAAVAGKLQGLSAGQLHDAFGITFSQAGATVQAAKDGALAKRLQPAFNASDGIRAVSLAQIGVTGIHNVFEGRFGFYRLFNHSDCDRQLILDGLGERFHGTDLTIKRYPTSRCAHAPIEGTIALVKAHNILPGDVENVQVSVSEGCLNVAGAPFTQSMQQSQTSAQFCIGYAVAAAITWRDVFVDQVQQEALNSPGIMELASKVRVTVDPALSGEMSFTPVTLRIDTRSGESYTHTVTSLKGSPGNQLTWDEVVRERLQRAARYSARPLEAADVKKLEHAVATLETLDDANVIAGILNGVESDSTERRDARKASPSVTVRAISSGSDGNARQDAIHFLVRHVLDTDFDRIPFDAVQATKKSVLDSLATTIAGSSAEGCQEVAAYLGKLGGRQDSRIAFYPGAVPAHHAVMANIMMCHALELDDLYDDAVAHASTPAIWSAFATADRLRGCNGKDFLAAVMLGADVKCRIAAAAPHTFSNGHHNALLAGFAAVATAGKLTGASEEVLQNAFGLVLSQAAASVQALPDGALVKRLQPALNAADGLRSLDFASNGVTGVRNVLEGQFGFCSLFNHAPCDVEALTRELGSRFLGAESSIKRYPSSRCTHAPIQGVLHMAHEHALKPDDIAVIEVQVSATCAQVAGLPWSSVKGSPQVNAQFNIPYCVAAGLVWGEFFVPQINELIGDERVRALADRIKVSVIPEGREKMTFVPVEIKIRTKQGRVLSHRVERLKGSPADPMSWDEIVQERVERCAAHAGGMMSEPHLQLMIERVRHLDELPDVRTILDLFQNPQSAAKFAH